MKEALKGTDTEMIKMATDGLSKAFGEIAQKIYAQQGPQQGAPDMGGTESQANTNTNASGSDYVDADFKEVDDDKQ